MSRAAAIAVVAAILLAVGTAVVPAQPTIHTIVIEEMKFSPASLTIKRGDTVMWVNKDFFPHNVTAENRTFESPELGTGKNWRYVPAKAGSFSYMCTLHPTMKGTLIVE